MRWPWIIPPNVAEAKQASEEAATRLEESRGRWPEVRRRAEFARGRVDANHLTAIFFDGRRTGKKAT